jgi:hypothetical protein
LLAWVGGRSLAGFNCCDLSLPDVELIEVLKQSVEIRNPQDQDDDHYAIQERFDLSLHGDESVHKPQQDACCNNRDEDSGKWHIMYSNLFPDSIRSGLISIPAGRCPRSALHLQRPTCRHANCSPVLECMKFRSGIALRFLSKSSTFEAGMLSNPAHEP